MEFPEVNSLKSVGSSLDEIEIKKRAKKPSNYRNILYTFLEVTIK